MKALVYRGLGKKSLAGRPTPKLQSPTDDGTQAEYVLISRADTSLHAILDGAEGDALVMLSDILPTGFELRGAERQGCARLDGRDRRRSEKRNSRHQVAQRKLTRSHGGGDELAQDVSERAAAVRGVLNRLGPYYDPDFPPLAPHPNIEPGAAR
jgi:hypothetical protein